MKLHISININMRCIEMEVINLKTDCIGKININMRCIEMCITITSLTLGSLININMRCIEMKFNDITTNSAVRLTLT